MIASRALLQTLTESLTRREMVDIALGPLHDGQPRGLGWGHRVTAIDTEERTFKTDSFDDPVDFDDVLQIRRGYGLDKKYPYEDDEDNPTVVKARSLPNWREPVVGQTCWVRTSLFIDHGWDDFQGGKATIKAINRNWLCTNAVNRLSVVIEERPGSQYNWYILLEEEERNRELYGDRRAYEDPEYHPFYAPEGR